MCPNVSLKYATTGSFHVHLYNHSDIGPKIIYSVGKPSLNKLRNLEYLSFGLFLSGLTCFRPPPLMIGSFTFTFWSNCHVNWAALQTSMCKVSKDNAKCSPHSGPGSRRKCHVNKVPSRCNVIYNQLLIIFVKETKILKQ